MRLKFFSMKLNVGDRVKYLDSTGGGVITKVIDRKMVMVSDQDGFEIPTLISELVKIESGEAAARFFDENREKPLNLIDHGLKEKEEEELQVESLDPHVIRNRSSEDIYLAYVPHDQKWLITGLVDVYLINNTSFDIIYNLFHRVSSRQYKGIDYGSLFADSRYLLDTVNRDDLTEWSDGSLQFLFHKEHTTRVLPPFNSDFQVDGKKFYKEGAYRESSLIREKGIIIKVVSLSDYLKEEEESEDIPVSPPKPTKKEDLPIIFTHQTEPRKAEVDLHIHELVEDQSNLQKSEILEFQKNYFLRCLDSAVQHNFLNVIFIHGVGNGVLRDVLIDQLKKTEGIEFFDAPMINYGVGALEVRIPHNR